ncbi:MAG: acetate--CoA ligase family protein [Deltaproteobacteria bacterium]|nr:acetate--CoA ligase family protein [Deltaproteobacteria bacterium]
MTGADEVNKILDRALEEGRKQLSEHESKRVLAAYGIPVTREVLVRNEGALVEAARKIGYPLVMKACAPELAHKTEQNLVRVDVRNDGEALGAFREIVSNMRGISDEVLVQEMVRGRRELVVGLNRDPQFGPCVMFGLGGVFTEILKDVCFRIAPLSRRDALDMMQEIRGRKILGAVRGMEPADLESLAHILVEVGRLGLEAERILEIDINPLILSKGKPVAVDAFIALGPSG